MTGGKNAGIRTGGAVYHAERLHSRRSICAARAEESFGEARDQASPTTCFRKKIEKNLNFFPKRIKKQFTKKINTNIIY